MILYLSNFSEIVFIINAFIVKLLHSPWIDIETGSETLPIDIASVITMKWEMLTSVKLVFC